MTCSGRPGPQRWGPGAGRLLWGFIPGACVFLMGNLRHTFCTRLCESTNDIKFIQQVMGHADFSTTMDIYTHITQESMEEKAATIKGNLVLM